MARVCEEWFPVGSYPRQTLPGFYMDDILKQQIDVLLRNIRNDWDFTIIISAGGEVRVGKSVLGMQIGMYWVYSIWKMTGKRLPFDCKHNFVFEGKKLISQGNYLGTKYPYNCLIFDEAGADLEGRKTMQKVTQSVLDYFRECGQYNMLNILVIPEFFDLPKTIARSRSVFLLDVYYRSDQEGVFERGYFKFYSRRSKSTLYRKGKRELDYNSAVPNFSGRFDNVFTVDKEEYKRLKKEALSKRDENKKETETYLVKKWRLMASVMLELLLKEGYTKQSVVDNIHKKTNIKISHMVMTRLSQMRDTGHVEPVFKTPIITTSFQGKNEEGLAPPEEEEPLALQVQN